MPGAGAEIVVPAGATGPPQLAPDLPATVMVEAYVAGRELTVSVLGDRALGVTEILTDGWYDYHAKYAPGGPRQIITAGNPANITDANKDYDLHTHKKHD